MPKTQVIIAAAGEGTRLKSAVPKPLVTLAGKPILVYSLELFEKCALVESIIVVAHPESLKTVQDLVREYQLHKVKKVVAGGATRQESVANGLAALDPDTQFVAIHDGARPLVSLRTVEEALSVCYDVGSVIVAVPVKPTIKRVNPADLSVVATVDRWDLWEVQTPQVFRRELIERAHQDNRIKDATDDAALVEGLGEPVRVVRGDYRNIKVTTPEDLVIAQALLAEAQ